jgi:hypothetical protein
MLAHPDIPRGGSKLLPDFRFVQLVAWTGTALIPSAGTSNVGVFPFPRLAHVVQFVRGLAFDRPDRVHASCWHSRRQNPHMYRYRHTEVHHAIFYLRHTSQHDLAHTFLTI